MEIEWISVGIGFISGVLTGGVGGYYSNKFTDIRKSREMHKETNKEFKNLTKKMPDLLKEIHEDLTGEKGEYSRNIFILSSQSCAFNGTGFVYYESEHKDLKEKMQLLEDKGFINETYISSNVPSYRLNEEFVELVKKWNKK